MTDRDKSILERSEKMCHYCCNFDKEHIGMDGMALCKLTMTLAYDEDYSGNCMFYNVPKEQIIVPPCKVGDIYYTIDRYCNTDPWETEKELVRAWDCEQYCGRSDCSFSELRINEHRFGSVVFILENQKYFGQYYFLTKEDAERALKERSEGK